MDYSLCPHVLAMLDMRKWLCVGTGVCAYVLCACKNSKYVSTPGV